MRRERVEIRPDVMFGKPVIRGTRIPVELILRKLAAGQEPAEIRGQHPRLTIEDIQAAQARAADVAEGGATASAAAVTAEEAARQELRGMLSGPSRWRGHGPEPSEDELMEEIVAGIKEDRRIRRGGDHR